MKPMFKLIRVFTKASEWCSYTLTVDVDIHLRSWCLLSTTGRQNGLLKSPISCSSWNASSDTLSIWQVLVFSPDWTSVISVELACCEEVTFPWGGSTDIMNNCWWVLWQVSLVSSAAKNLQSLMLLCCSVWLCAAPSTAYKQRLGRVDVLALWAMLLNMVKQSSYLLMPLCNTVQCNTECETTKSTCIWLHNNIRSISFCL